MSSAPKDHRLLLLLVALCLLFFFFYLGSRALWDVDEGMHSVSAKYVVESGDWVTPNYNGEAFLDKPMFFTWLVAISFSLLGYSELAARLPAAILGLGGVLVTYFLGRRMFGARTGFLGGSILATSLLYLVMSRSVVHDSALAFFTTLALFLFYLGVVDTEARRRKVFFLLFYAAVAGAVVAKGPLGALLPALVIGSFLLLTKRLRLIREMQLGWGLLIFVVLASPWYILMSLRNEGYLSYFLIEKSFGSFASEESTHPSPFHFYIPVFLGSLLPWTGFFVPALYRAVRRLGGEERDSFLYLLLWLGMMFLFFSAATSKLASYLLPLMPASAILIAALWEEALVAPVGSARRSLLWSQIPMTILIMIGFGFGWLNPPVELGVKYGISVAQTLVVGLLITVGPILTLVLLLRGRTRAAFGSVIAVVAAVLLVFATWMGPAMDDYRSTRDLALEFDQMLPPGQPMVFFWREKDSALFYTDRDGVVLPTWDVEAYLASDSEVFFVADIRELERLRKHREDFAFVKKTGSKVVISNRPETEQTDAIPEGFAR